MKTYEALPHLSTRQEVERIVAENARHAAAPPLERLADALEVMAAEHRPSSPTSCRPVRPYNEPPLRHRRRGPTKCPTGRKPKGGRQ